MDYKFFNQYCASLKSATHSVQWGGAHVWKVGGKVFAIGGWQRQKNHQETSVASAGPAYTFKVSAHNYEVLKDQPGFRPAPYLGTRGMKWIQLFEQSAATNEQLQYYLSESHRIVSLGLTKKLQRQLGLNQH